MRIAHVCGSSGAGGAETFFVRLVAQLHADKALKILAIVRKGSWIEEQLRARGIPYKTAPFGGLLDLRTKYKIINIFKHLKPHIVQYWMNRAARFAPRITGVVNVGRLGGYYKLKYYRKMDFLIGNTPLITRYCVDNGWAENRVNYIPNFAPEAACDDMQEGAHIRKNAQKRAYIRKNMRQKMHIPEDAFVVLLAGRWHEVKGFDYALDAIVKTPFHTILLGPKREDIPAAYNNLLRTMGDRLHVEGWQSAITPYAYAADCWLIPSRDEPLGNTVLDAWAHSLPVVASMADGPNFLIDPPKTGLLFPIEDKKALQQALTEVQQTPALAHTLAQNGYAEWQKKYSPHVVANAYIAYYRTIATASKP